MLVTAKGLRREKVEVTSPTDENSSKEKHKEGKKKSTSLPRDLKVSFKLVNDLKIFWKFSKLFTSEKKKRRIRIGLHQLK